jgi:hypothetical protein
MLWIIVFSLHRAVEDFQTRFRSNMKHLVPLSILLALLCSICYASATSSNVLAKDPFNDYSEKCSCYLTSGPSSSYFQHHRFWDFRSIPADGTNNFTLAPPSLDSPDDLTSASPSSAYLSSSDFVKNWSIQNWTAGTDTYSPVSRVNSAQNIYISRNTTQEAEGSTYLTLRTSRTNDFISIAELESNQKNLLHCSIRARLRIISDPLSIPSTGSSKASEPTTPTIRPVPVGAVAGLFTYYSRTSESDIEILTRDPPNTIRYSNQPDYNPGNDSAIPGASTHSTLPSNKIYTEWLNHRIDWFDGLSRWWVDGEMVLEKTINVPRDPSGLILNLWSDGGEWSGGMSVGSEVVLGVEWIEMVFNTSGSIQGPPVPSGKMTSSGPGGKDGGGRRGRRRRGRKKSKRGGVDGNVKTDEEKCKVACSVDGVRKVGFPELLLNTGAATATATATAPATTATATTTKNTTQSIPSSAASASGFNNTNKSQVQV